MAIGFLCLAIIFIGLILPSGKFAFIQAIVVSQVISFSFLQFDILPLAYLGFRKLFFSSGFNSLSNSNIDIVQKEIFSFFGMQTTSFISNYNMAFFVLCLCPLLIGFIPLYIIRKMSQ